MRKNGLTRFGKSLGIIFLGIFAFLTRFAGLGYINKVVFDETHFGLYAAKYLSHQYYFDIHPPLGKLLLSLSGFLGGVNSGFDFAPGSSYGDFNFLALRFLPAFFGSLLVVLVYFLVLELGFSRRAAFLAGFLVLFDNAFLVQSRLILLDIMLVFFIFLSFYFFILARKTRPLSRKWLALSSLLGLFLAAALSIKWTGLGILAMVLFLTIFEDRLFSKPKKEIMLKVFFVVFLPVVLYFLVFSIHFSLLPSGCADNCGEMLNNFLNDKKSSYFNNPSDGGLMANFIEVNKFILLSNLSESSGNYYQSKWYSWPFLVRPIQYFQERNDGKISSLYFLGNPFVWWLGLLAVLAYFYLIVRNYVCRFKMKLPAALYSRSAYFLILGWLAYFLPFASIERFMMAYHYLPALVFSIMIFSVLTEQIKSKVVFGLILLLVLAGFIYFLPLSYGILLTEAGFQARMWLPVWSF